MTAAVQRECAARAKDKATALNKSELKSVAAWLCSGDPVFFLRGIQADGGEDRDGFVCEGEALWKYYAADLPGDDLECVAVYYDSDTKAHALE